LRKEVIYEKIFKMSNFYLIKQIQRSFHHCPCRCVWRVKITRLISWLNGALKFGFYLVYYYKGKQVEMLKMDKFEIIKIFWSDVKLQ